MALTHFISDNDDFKLFFKSIIPSKREFSTLSGHSPFSKEYVVQAPYKMEKQYNSSTVGTAFDYLARWIIARIITENKEQAYTDLIAEDGVFRCKNESERLGIDLAKEYKALLENCKLYVHGTGDIEDLIKTAIFFAKLEQVFRRNLLPFQIDLKYLLLVEDEVVDDLKKLITVFKRVIADTHIVHKNSIVVFNPTFGGASCIIGGADADVYIDGVLYDFKCTKKTGYDWCEVAQIYGYFLLSKIAKHYNDADNMLRNHDINRIAFYRARYGEIEYFDLTKDTYEQEIQDFIRLVGEDEYEHYFEQQRKQIEEENARQQEIEKINECYKRIKNYINTHSYFEYTDAKLANQPDEEKRINIIRFTLSMFSKERIKDDLCSQKLKHQMELKNIRISDLAKTLDVSPNTIRNWLNEKNNPNVLALIKMTQIFECSVTDLIRT